MASDAELIEASLAVCAGADLRHPLFDRFFARFPERQASFYNTEVSSVRMTDETLQMMHGLAAGENWVRPLVAELTFTHRNYGYLPTEEYDAFIDMTVDVVAEACANWNAETEDAWRCQAETLKVMIREAREGWARAMPGQVTNKKAPDFSEASS